MSMSRTARGSGAPANHRNTVRGSRTNTSRAKRRTERPDASIAVRSNSPSVTIFRLAHLGFALSLHVDLSRSDAEPKAHVDQPRLPVENAGAPGQRCAACRIAGLIERIRRVDRVVLGVECAAPLVSD